MKLKTIVQLLEKFGLWIQHTYESIRRPYKIQNAFVLLLICCVFSLVLFYQIPGFIFEWRSLIIDKLLRGREPSDQLVIVTIDDRSLQEIGAWPWERDVYADLVEKLSQEGPRVVGIDVILAENREGDDVFVEAVKNSDIDLVLASKIVGGQEVVPIKELEDYVSYGFVNYPSDFDGKVRNTYVIQNLDGRCISSFSFEILGKFFGQQRELNCRDWTVELGFTYIRTNDGLVKVNYVGPAGSYEQISFADVINGDYPEDYFREKIILVGPTAVDLNDNLFNPYDGKVIPSVEIHANVINTILENTVLYPVPISTQVLMLISISLLFYLITYRMKVNTSMIIFLISFFVYEIFVLVMFEFGWIFDPLITPIALACTWVLTIVYQYSFKNLESSEIRRAFGQYIHPEVLQSILSDPVQLTLGGETKILTILFTDIRDFTTLCENLSAKDLISFLNRYFDNLSEIVLRYRGTIDKYEGDTLLAFWNAPTNNKKQAFYACKTAIGMIRSLAAFNEKYKDFQQVNMGVGINTGEVVVGNVGSSQRFDYTVVGDEVNVASRLEGLTKKYKVRIIIGEKTVKRLVKEKNKEVFSIRLLDIVRVKGRNKKICIYELMGYFSKKFEGHINSYERAFHLYQKKQFQTAMGLFQKISKKYKDYPSEILWKRCRYYLNNGLPKSWDGAWDWETK